MAKSDLSGRRQNAAVVRCAIYTRKSSEEGLEQDFNSLHAQREACEAYVRSQRHEGWVVVPTPFDDGGISGGTLERPALHHLLAEIRAGKIDTIVVYKVDRLTRSLADFAKLVEILDGHNVAFVSVTQQFNTTTSMGRLTLNVLLSFAQFEREVTGERIRDKIAASKQRGMWMGGNPPLGFDVHDRKLVVNEAEAEQVRHIFHRYVALRSVRLLQEHLADIGSTSKLRIGPSGEARGGKVFARGALYLLLQNRIYLGEITHKDRHYPGQHPAIVDQELWHEARALLMANAGDRRSGASAKQPSLLAGLLFDGQGHRMSPTHAVKVGKRYRYYISRPLVSGLRGKAPGALRIPAIEVEQVVCERIRTWLADASAVHDAISSATPDAEAQGALITRAAALARSWSDLPTSRQRQIIGTMISRIEVSAEAVTLHLTPTRLGAILQAWPDNLEALDAQEIETAAAEPTLTLKVDVQLRRIEKSGQLFVHDASTAAAQPNEPLIQLVVRAHKLQQSLLGGGKTNLGELAAHAALSENRVALLLRLSWLAPDITKAILHGQQPPSLTADRLSRISRIPIDWQAQRALLGIS